MLPGSLVQMVEANPDPMYDAEKGWRGVRIYPGSTTYEIYGIQIINGYPYFLLLETLRRKEDLKYPYPAAWFREVGTPLIPAGVIVMETSDIPLNGRDGMGKNILQG